MREHDHDEWPGPADLDDVVSALGDVESKLDEVVQALGNLGALHNAVGALAMPLWILVALVTALLARLLHWW